MTRREMVRLLGWVLLPSIPRGANAGDFSRERRYRVDAQVLIFSLPILHRSGVGGGRIVWREWQEATGSMRLLEFAGYSNPERAAGLNRLGLIRERSSREDQAIRESSYFGVMTASPEESAEEAHQALHSTATETVYTAIRGSIAGGHVETATAHFTGPARLSPERRDELFARAEQVLATAPTKPPEFRVNGAIPALFLHALADVLRTPNRGQSGMGIMAVSRELCSNGCSCSGFVARRATIPLARGVLGADHGRKSYAQGCSVVSAGCCPFWVVHHGCARPSV